MKKFSFVERLCISLDVGDNDVDKDNDNEGGRLGPDICTTGGIQIITNQCDMSLMIMKMIQLKKSMLSVAIVVQLSYDKSTLSSLLLIQTWHGINGSLTVGRQWIDKWSGFENDCGTLWDHSLMMEKHLFSGRLDFPSISRIWCWHDVVLVILMRRRGRGGVGRQ